MMSRAVLDNDDDFDFFELNRTYIQSEDEHARIGNRSLIKKFITSPLTVEF